MRVKRCENFKKIYDKLEPLSIKVEVFIILNFFGKETRKTFNVWGDNGSLCRPYLSTFRIDNIYVVAFEEGKGVTELNANKEVKKSDYAISRCGDYWLTADTEQQIAKGSVSKNQTEICFADLWKYFNNIKRKAK